jgi:hypothetical protein
MRTREGDEIERVHLRNMKGDNEHEAMCFGV